jgi:phosphoribosylformimino-5-aminoimidazole carboxamide ribotide isomerase
VNALQIIPVIDLLDGVVVHAKKGLRHLYQPIESQLTASSKPLDIVKAFMDIYPFDCLYIADLNAIQRSQTETMQYQKTIEAILNTFDDLQIWLDAGFRNQAELNALNTLKNVTPILASENINDIEQYQSMADELKQQFCLSLDYMANGYAGPIELLEFNHYWPDKVIAMTLKQVGSNAGLDTMTLNQIQTRANGHHIYAAGGIRSADDLILLNQLSISGVLIATALHNQQLKTSDLTNFGQ